MLTAEEMLDSDVAAGRDDRRGAEGSSARRTHGRFCARAREVGYLVNVWIAGGTHEGRQPRPAEAMDRVLRTCESGLKARLAPGKTTAGEALAVLARTSADALFRRAP